MAFFSLGCCCASTDEPQFSAVAMWRAEMNGRATENGIVYGEERSQHGRQQEGAGSQTAAAATTAKEAFWRGSRERGDTEGA